MRMTLLKMLTSKAHVIRNKKIEDRPSALTTREEEQILNEGGKHVPWFEMHKRTEEVETVRSSE
jgi:hypothetical protein